MRIRTEAKGDYINERDKEIAVVANALAHPLRIALVRYLLEKNRGGAVDSVTCNKDLVELFDYSQSTISQHVKILKEAKVFVTESKNTFTFYSVDTDVLYQFTRSLTDWYT